MGGRVSVEWVPAARSLTAGDGLEDDQPTVAVDSNSVGYVAWIGYRGGKEVLILSRSDGSERQTIAEGEFFRPTLAAGLAGRLYLAVSVRADDTWKIAVATRQGNQWSKLNFVSSGGPDLYPRLAVNGSGQLWVVWQGFRKEPLPDKASRSRILGRSFDGQTWAPEITMSENSRNAWEPAVAADSKGRFHFAWDAYDDGAYNIYYRLHDGRNLGRVQQITRGEKFQAHVSLACDGADRPWLAWDDGGPNWGKDTGFLIKKNVGTALYEQRQVRLAVLAETGISRPALPSGFLEQPQLLSDAKGNIWCLLRRRDIKLHEVWSQALQRNRLQQYSLWDYVALTYSGDGWSAPIPLPFSFGRNDVRAAMAARGDSTLVAAWTGDGRAFSKPYPFVKNDIYTGEIPAVSHAETSLNRASPAQENSKAVHPNEAAQVAVLRTQRLAWGDKSLRVLCGDMHRHTDISFDGDVDGSVWDFYRYTIDAADFDYSALTDHNAGDDNEYFWWIIQKSNDLFHYPGRFVPVYAYERSLRYPNGHRNLLWARRGVRTLPKSADEESGKEGAARLYAYLRQSGGLAMPHTSGTLMGTDWRDNDKDLEPLVEIYQGDRTSYEYEGAPRAATAKDRFSQPGGYQPDGFVWNAWAKGYKLGVQASSDHASTHVSYAILMAEDLTRDAILNAIRTRHAYAATDNILLDVRSGEHIQGDIFSTSERPSLDVRINGTATLEKVEIIKNNKFVFTDRPGKTSIQFRFEDRDAKAGESYYYVRVQQSDGQLAWSSPLWITFHGQ